MKAIDKMPMPNGMPKKRMIDLLLKEEYGFLPDVNCHITAQIIESDDFFCAGKAIYKKILLSCQIGDKFFSFPIHYTQCVSHVSVPCVIHINFRDNVPDKYQPTEEIIDSGHSIISFNYEDVTKDDDDFTDGLAGIIYNNGERSLTDCGKIGLWAWAVMRVMDYAMTLPEIDYKRISVAGHSRLGKTALLAGALDDRFYCAYSNNSGCSGAAVSRDKKGERISDIYKQFGYWFSKGYEKYADNEYELPFDQHFLLAANAPHRVYVASAREDFWADPESEYLSCYLASSYFQEKGLFTLIDKKMPRIGKRIKKGHIGYHIRTGKHYFSRKDWDCFLDYLKAAYNEDKGI